MFSVDSARQWYQRPFDGGDGKKIDGVGIRKETFFYHLHELFGRNERKAVSYWCYSY